MFINAKSESPSPMPGFSATLLMLCMKSFPDCKECPYRGKLVL